MSDKQILISDDLYMMVRALEFFVDYKFSTGTWMQQEYIKRMNEIDHNEWAKLCYQEELSNEILKYKNNINQN